MFSSLDSLDIGPLSEELAKCLPILYVFSALSKFFSFVVQKLFNLIPSYLLIHQIS